MAMSGRPPPCRLRPRAHPLRAARFVGILLLVLMGFRLDASGKCVMNASGAAAALSWFRYVVHLILVLALVLPTRGFGAAQEQAARTIDPRRLHVPGHADVLHAQLHPQAEARSSILLAPLLVLSVAPWVLSYLPACRASWRRALRLSASSS